MKTEFDELFNRCLTTAKKSKNDVELAFGETRVENGQKVSVEQKAIIIERPKDQKAIVSKMRAAFISPNQ